MGSLGGKFGVVELLIFCPSVSFVVRVGDVDDDLFSTFCVFVRSITGKEAGDRIFFCRLGVFFFLAE